MYLINLWKKSITLKTILYGDSEIINKYIIKNKAKINGLGDVFTKPYALCVGICSRKEC